MRMKEITHAASHVNTPVYLTAMAAASAFGTLSLTPSLRRGRRRLDDRGGFREVRRQLHMGSNDPHQHLVILGATAIGFKPPYQRQGLFRTQIDLLEIVKQFEESKHEGFHSGRSHVGLRLADVDIRGLI